MTAGRGVKRRSFAILLSRKRRRCRPSPLHAYHLLQHMDDVDQIGLRGHDSVDRLVGAGRLVEHVGIPAAHSTPAVACVCFATKPSRTNVCFSAAVRAISLLLRRDKGTPGLV